MICFSETWATDNSICNDSNFQIENYTVLHQVRESGRGGGLSIFVNKANINKNILFRVMYRPPNGDMTVFEKFCENLLFANDKTSKNIIFAGDLNINILGYEFNKKVQHFLSSMFQYNMTSNINKPTRVTRNTATAMDHIITNTVISGIQRMLV